MPLLSSIVDFLRAGYPEGVPRQDYIPLLALLRRQLTDEEVREVAAEVLADDRSSQDRGAAIERAIRDITNEPPLHGDLARVAARLAAVGWPLASLRSVS